MYSSGAVLYAALQKNCQFQSLTERKNWFKCLTAYRADTINIEDMILYCINTESLSITWYILHSYVPFTTDKHYSINQYVAHYDSKNVTGLYVTGMSKGCKGVLLQRSCRSWTTLAFILKLYYFIQLTRLFFRDCSVVSMSVIIRTDCSVWWLPVPNWRGSASFSLFPVIWSSPGGL